MTRNIGNWGRHEWVLWSKEWWSLGIQAMMFQAKDAVLLLVCCLMFNGKNDFCTSKETRTSFQLQTYSSSFSASNFWVVATERDIRIVVSFRLVCGCQRTSIFTEWYSSSTTLWEIKLLKALCRVRNQFIFTTDLHRLEKLSLNKETKIMWITIRYSFHTR